MLFTFVQHFADHVLCAPSPFPFCERIKTHANTSWPSLQGIRIDERAPEADQLLGKVLSHLESDKPYIYLDQERDGEYCERFAVGVFRNAENKDRAGQANRETAKGYYAASIFLEVAPCRT